ncbi:MAG: SufE family protein [Thermoplasmatota archaeon]
MNEDINKIQDEIIKEFSQLDDWFDKYEYLITLGKKLESFDEKLKTDDYSIGGCQSQVWIKAEMNNGKVKYCAESDSLFVKGMIYLILKTLNNQKPQDILSTDLYFIDKIGLSSNLSPSRANGLVLIVKQIKTYAKNFSTS